MQWLFEVEGWDWTKIFEYLGVEAGRTEHVAASHDGRQPVAPREQVGRRLDELEPLILPPQQWREHAEKFVSECATALEKNQRLIEWLARRGVPLAVAKNFRLGWHAGEPQKSGRQPCAYRSREGWGLEPQANQNGRQKAIWFPRGLVIPNDRDGQLVAVRIRRPGIDVSGGEKKYVLVTGSNQRGCMITPGAKAYVVVEAGLDGIAIMAAGVEGVGMCAMGSLSAYPDKEAAEHLSSAIDILQALDFEPQGKGEKYGNKFRSWWGARFPQCRRTPMPVGKDPGELVEQIGLPGLRTWIESQLSPSVRLAAPPPKGTIVKAPPKEDSRLPDAIQELYALLVSSGGEVVMSPRGMVLSVQVPGDMGIRAVELTRRPIVLEWLGSIDPEAHVPHSVTAKNFKQPLEAGR